MKVGIKWNGLKEMKAALATYANDINDGTRPIMEVIAQSAATAMRAAYPRSNRARRAFPNPGPLADSVVVGATQSTGTSTKIPISNTAYYSGWFEDGTRYTDPGRVFRPIYRQAKRNLVSAIKNEFKKYNLRVK